MNMNFSKSLRCWAALLMCCVVLTTAQAQDAAPPPKADDCKTTTFDSVSKDDSSSEDSSNKDDEDISEHHHHRHHRDRDSDDVVSIGHRAELRAGEHADSVVAVFGSATSAGDVEDAVVSVLGTTRITGGKVNNSAVAVMGSAYINGEVNGDVVAVMGNVELGPEAKVHGNVVVVGGELKKDPNAVIDGHVQHVFGVDWADFDWLRPWMERCLLYGRPLAFGPGLGWVWGIALGLLALYAFIAFLFRGAVDKCVHTLETDAGHSILAALLLTLGIPVLFVLLFITVLGIAAVPFLVIAVLCAAMFGKIVVLATIGKRCTPSLANDPATHTVVGVIVGGLILMLIYTIPVVGFVVYKLLELLGLGVVVYTLLLSVRAGRLARTGGGPGAGPAPGGGTAGLGGGLEIGRPGTSWRGGAAGGGGPSAAASRASEFGDFTADGPPQNATARGFASGIDDGAADFYASGPNATGADTAAMGASASGAGPSDAGHTDGGRADAGRTNTGESNMGSDSVGAGAAGAAGVSAAGSNASGGNGPGGQPPLNLSALPRAGVGIRMGALLLDLILIGIITHQLPDFGDVHLIALAAYGAVMWKLKGSTIGGIICGLQVARVDGRPVDWPTAIVRALGCFLSLAVVGLGFIWIAIDHDHQAWHDKIAGTVVVRAPKGTSLL